MEEGLKLIPYITIAICIAGIIAGASSLSVSKFGDTMTQCNGDTSTLGTLVYNNTLDICHNATQTANTTPTDEYNSVIYTQDGIGDVSEQLSTVAIIGIMVIIISLIAGVFVYMRYF